jgi:hypothetical protein
MARVLSRPDRRDRDVCQIDFAVTDPRTGQTTRKRERVGCSRSQAEDALESRLTDIRCEKFDHIFPEPDCKLKEIWPRYLTYSKATKSERQVERKRASTSFTCCPVSTDSTESNYTGPS